MTKEPRAPEASAADAVPSFLPFLPAAHDLSDISIEADKLTKSTVKPERSRQSRNGEFRRSLSTRGFHVYLRGERGGIPFIKIRVFSRIPLQDLT